MIMTKVGEIIGTVSPHSIHAGAVGCRVPEPAALRAAVRLDGPNVPPDVVQGQASVTRGALNEASLVDIVLDSHDELNDINRKLHAMGCQDSVYLVCALRSRDQQDGILARFAVSHR